MSPSTRQTTRCWAGQGNRPWPTGSHKLKPMLQNNPPATARYQRLKQAGWARKGLNWEVAPWLVLSAINNPDITKQILLLDPGTAEAYEYQWRVCQPMLGNIREIVKSDGGAFAAVLLATPAQTSAEFPVVREELGIDIPGRALRDARVNNLLGAYCRQAKISCIDTLGAFRAGNAARRAFLSG